MFTGFFFPEQSRIASGFIVAKQQTELNSLSLQLALEVAPCKPLSNLLDTAEIIACSFLVDSMVMTSGRFFVFLEVRPLCCSSPWSDVASTSRKST